jgi:trigger factor
MRATSDTLENNRVKLTVHVEQSELDEAINATAKELAQQIQVKGFRKGKVPRAVLERQIGGPVALRAKAIREHVPNFYAKAVADTLIDPIANPDVTITEGEEDRGTRLRGRGRGAPRDQT